MKVWIVEDCPPYEPGNLIGVYATEELADEAAARQQYQDWVAVYDQDVITELPPWVPPHRAPPYQIIP